jgi:hypothetical protein
LERFAMFNVLFIYVFFTYFDSTILDGNASVAVGIMTPHV